MRAVLLSLLGSLAVAGVDAFDINPSSAALADAVTLGRTTREARRAEFHEPYRLFVNQAPLDYIDVVTPFRRVVLAARAGLLAGERLFGQREALATLRDRGEQLELRLELTFHPLNTFAGVPAYEADLTSVQTLLPTTPASVERIPRFGPRVEGLPTPTATQGVGLLSGETQPLLGGTLVLTFDGRRLDRAGTYVLALRDKGTVLSRGLINLAALR